MTKKDPKAPVAQPERKGLFDMFGEVDDATRGGDINNLELNIGDNKFRILQAPMLIRKHWDLPASSELVAVPCRKHITDLAEYASDPQGYLDGLAKCEYCEWAEKHPGFYVVKDHWIFNVVQDGVVKIAEFTQKSILRAIARFEKDVDWLPLMPNGLHDLEINVKKVQTGKEAQNIKYEVGGVPTSRPLSDEQLEEYRSQAVDLMKLKAPPGTDDDGNAKWKEYLQKAGEPKEGEKSKKLAR